MRCIGALLLVALVIAFQSATEVFCRIRDVAPHLTFLLVGWAALSARRREAMFTAVAAGLLLDFLSLDPWGANTAPLFFLAHVLSRAARAGWADAAIPCAVLVGVALPLTFLSRDLLVWLLDGVSPLWSQEAATAAYTLALTWPAFSVLHRWGSPLLGIPRSPAT